MVRKERSGIDDFEYWVWYFPGGTQFVEFARVADTAGQTHVFQVNQLTLDAAGWEPTIFRSELIASAAGLPEYSGELLDASVVDKGHPRRQSFSERGTLFNIAAMSPSLLDTSFFVKAPESWGTIDGIEVAGPTTTETSLVQKNFMGCLIGVSRASCARCHQDAGQHVSQFDAFGNQRRNDSGAVGQRHWYGKVRGNDRILSWHPFAESTISTNGGNNKVELRKIDIAAFDPKKHTVVDYPGMLK